MSLSALDCCFVCVCERERVVSHWLQECSTRCKIEAAMLVAAACRMLTGASLACTQRGSVKAPSTSERVI